MRKRDMILAGGILLVSALLLMLQKQLPSQGEGSVLVYQEKELLASYPLREAHREYFYTKDGKHNLLVIRDGEVWIEEADCPDQLCRKQGKIFRTGQSLTCLPHRLTVRIEGGKENPVDAVTG